MAALEAKEIMQVLPQGWPWMQIDRVLELEVEGEIGSWRIVALKNVSADAPWAGSHFPKDPVMPGTSIEEVMAQAGAILLMQLPDSAGKTPFNAGWKEVRHRKPVLPGDQLIIEAGELRMKGDFGNGRVVRRDGTSCLLCTVASGTGLLIKPSKLKVA